MATVKPPVSRIMITDIPGKLHIVIPCSRSWFIVGFLGFWICGWAVAEYMVSSQFLKGDAPPEGESFMLAWFVVWTVGGLLAIYAWLWQIIGKEMITLHGQTFTTRRDVGGFGFDKEYDIRQMRNLRAAQVGFNPLDISSSLQLWGIGGGVIAFDYGVRTVRFGAGLDEAEAEEVLATITQRFHIQEGRKT